jgi:translation initiation factor IF-1
MSSDKMEFEGIILENSRDIFRVKVNDNLIVNCTLSGKIRQNMVRILPGDKVIIVISEYDTNKGRIVFRLR